MNVHEKQIDELQMKIEPEKCKTPAENAQDRMIGCTTLDIPESYKTEPKVATMSKLRCCFCQQELHKDSDGYYTCYTDNCGCMKHGGNGASGSKSLWLALMHTCKALGKAKSVLTSLHDYARLDGFQERDVEEALAEIKTALEQKDIK